jgi:hypothetical protein
VQFVFNYGWRLKVRHCACGGSIANSSVEIATHPFDRVTEKADHVSPFASANIGRENTVLDADVFA